MIFMLYMCSVKFVIGSGPPGIQPPLSFHAEQWYPSNLPTVLPPWKEAGLDIDAFRTSTLPSTTIPSTESAISSSESMPSVDSTNLTLTVDNSTSLEANETTVSTTIVSVLETTTVTTTITPRNETTSNSSEIASEITESPSLSSNSIISNENMTENSTFNSTEPTKENSGNVGASNSTEQPHEIVGIPLTSNSSGLSRFAGRELTIDDIDNLLILSAQTHSNGSSNITTRGDETEENLPFSTLATLDPNISNSTEGLTDVQGESCLIFSITLKDPLIGNFQQLVMESNSTFGAPIGNTLHSGTAQEPGENSICSDLFFVLDSSGNVVEQYEKQKLYIGNIVMQLSDRDRHYGLMTYAGRARQRVNIPPQLQISKELFVKKLLRARFLSGITATGAALRTVSRLQFVHRTDVIVITDGFSFDTVNADAQLLRDQPNVRVLVAGDYTPVVRQVLNSIAGDPENVFLGSRSTEQMVHFLNC